MYKKCTQNTINARNALVHRNCQWVGPGSQVVTQSALSIARMRKKTSRRMENAQLAKTPSRSTMSVQNKWPGLDRGLAAQSARIVMLVREKKTHMGNPQLAKETSKQ